MFSSSLEWPSVRAERQWAIDLKGLLGDPSALVVTHVMQGPHVVEPVRQLHKNDPDVLGHGEQHLPEVLRSRLLLRPVFQLAQLNTPSTRAQIAVQKGP